MGIFSKTHLALGPNLAPHLPPLLPPALGDLLAGCCFADCEFARFSVFSVDIAILLDFLADCGFGEKGVRIGVLILIR